MLKIVLAISLITIISCGKGTISDKESARDWMQKHGSGFIKKKKANNIEISITYLPSGYLSMMEADNHHEYDSLIKYYENGIYFIMEIGYMEKEGTGDIIMYDVKSEQEYNQRFLDLNFNLSSFLTMEINNQSYYPALCIMENTYGLSDSRKFNIAFSTEGLDEKTKNIGTIQLKFEDIFFETGISYFDFDLAELPDFPEVKF